MKLGILSDIHVDLNYEVNDPVEEALIHHILAQNIDYMIIAGDLSNDYKITLRTLEQIQEKTQAKCLFVPGNHDLWNINHPHADTRQIHAQLAAFEGNIGSSPIHLNDQWVVIGDTGWYDYSFGADIYGLHDFIPGKYMDRQWKDKEYVHWHETDQAKSTYYYEKIKMDLENNKHKKIIWVTHMVPHAHFIVQNPDKRWTYFNAFLGSRSYGDLIGQYQIPYAICGHVHYRRQAKINGTQYICSCLNYRDQWVYPQDAKKEVREAMAIIEL